MGQRPDSGLRTALASRVWVSRDGRVRPGLFTEPLESSLDDITVAGQRRVLTGLRTDRATYDDTRPASTPAKPPRYHARDGSARLP